MTSAEKGEVASPSHVERLEAELTAKRESCRRSLLGKMEYDFLKRPQPYAGIFFLSCSVIIFLVMTTTAVERIDLPFGETLASVRQTCLALESEVSTGRGTANKNEKDNSFVSSSGSRSRSTRLLLSDVLREFGDRQRIATSSSSSGAATTTEKLSVGVASKQTPTVLPTLPWPLPRHYNILFNVLVASDAYQLEPEKENEGPSQGVLTDETEIQSQNQTESTKKSYVHLRKVRASQLLQVAHSVADEAEAVTNIVRKRLSAERTSQKDAVALSGVTSGRADVTYRVEVATIREGALRDALDTDEDGVVVAQEQEHQYSSKKLLLSAAAKVASSYSLPQRYRTRMPPRDGLASLDSQVTFVIVNDVERTRAQADEEEQKVTQTIAGNKDSFSVVGCSVATNARDHFVCLIQAASEAKQSPRSSGHDDEVVAVDGLAKALGTVVSEILDISDFRPDTIAEWLHQRTAASCARSFVYLQHLISVLEENPRAAFPEELRPLWLTFTSNFFFGAHLHPTNNDKSTREVQQQQNQREGEEFFSHQEVAAGIIHQILFHPALIPEQTFPLDQMLVMYMPLLLPFVGALMQCVITLVKFKKNAKREMREAIEADKRTKEQKNTEQ